MPEHRFPLLPEKYYHVFNHANGDDNLFLEADNYRYFLEKYFYYINPVAETLAWCLMPNHFHFLIYVKPIEEFPVKTLETVRTLQGLKALEGFGRKTFNPSKGISDGTIISKRFSNLFNGYTQAFNNKYNRRGSLFVPRFQRKEVYSESFVDLIKYIHRNPVNHGFVNTPREWKNSSYNNYICANPPVLYENIIKELFDDIDNFKYVHEDDIES